MSIGEHPDSTDIVKRTIAFILLKSRFMMEKSGIF